MSHRGGGGGEGWSEYNRVVILERFRLLRTSVCRVASQLVFYCGTFGLNLEIAKLRFDSMKGVETKMYKNVLFR